MSATIATVRERPILMSGEMVRATLEDRKTKTRRVVKPGRRFPDQDGWGLHWDGRTLIRTSSDNIVLNVPSGRPASSMQDRVVRCPFGAPGDRLWVRETWAPCAAAEEGQTGRGVLYRADPFFDGMAKGDFAWDWKPSIFMPRWASRLTLEITDIDVERVQDISADDVTAEGLPYRQATSDFLIGSSTPDYRWYWGFPTPAWDGSAYYVYTTDHRYAFGQLWDSLNEDRPGCSWDANPFVWVVSFRRVPA